MKHGLVGLTLSLFFSGASVFAQPGRWTVRVDSLTGFEMRSPPGFRSLGVTSFDGELAIRLVRPGLESTGSWRRETEVWLVDLGRGGVEEAASSFEAFVERRLTGWTIAAREPLVDAERIEYELARAGFRGWARLGRSRDRRHAVVGLADAESFPADRSVFERCEESVRIRPSLRDPEARLRREYQGRGGWSQIDRRIRLRQRAPEDWESHDSEHFLLLHPARAGGWIREAAERLEALRSVLEARFPPREPIESVGVVRVCDDREEYRLHGGVPDAVGVWNARTEELVLHLDPEGSLAGPAGLLTLQHESVHLYFHQALGGRRPAPWFDEGLADTYAAARLGDRRLEGFDVNPQRAPRLETVRKQRGSMPLAKLLRATPGEYFRGGAATYAVGWSFVFFLETSPRSTEEGWKHLLDRYYRALAKEDSQGEALDPSTRRARALDAASRGIDLAKLEAAWQNFLEDFGD